LRVAASPDALLERPTVGDSCQQWTVARLIDFRGGLWAASCVASALAMRWDAILGGKWEVLANFTDASDTVAAIPVKTRMRLMHNASKSTKKKSKVRAGGTPMLPARSCHA